MSRTRIGVWCAGAVLPHTFLGILAVASTLSLPQCAAARQIVLGMADGISVDQPRVEIGMEDPANLGVSVGPELYTSAVLDTGSNGLMLGQLAHIMGESYEQARRPDGSLVYYYESGVAGTEQFQLLKPYHFNFAGADGYVRAVEYVNVLAKPDLELGSFCGIAGMPVMQGRAVRMDLRTIYNPLFIETSFHDAMPAADSRYTSFSVPLTKLAPQWTGLEQPDDPKPTFAPLPLVNVGHSFGGQTEYQPVLLDTGSQMSIISQSMADRLGINLDPADPNNHIVDLDGDGLITDADYIELGGIGGTVKMPTTLLSGMRIPTITGDELVLTDVNVGVVDIAGIDGVFGMNILTSGYGDLIYGETWDPATQYGIFGQITFDFTGENWQMRLETNPAYVPEPIGMVALGVTVLLALQLRPVQHPRSRTMRTPRYGSCASRAVVQ